MPQHVAQHQPNVELMLYSVSITCSTKFQIICLSEPSCSACAAVTLLGSCVREQWRSRVVAGFVELAVLQCVQKLTSSGILSLQDLLSCTVQQLCH